MNFRIVKALYKKEILDVLRDKKTVVMMLVVPLILYPLMLVAGMYIMTSVSTSMSEQNYKVALAVEEDTEDIEKFFLENQDDGYSISIVDVDDLEQALASGDIDLFIEKKVVDGKDTFVISYLSAITNSNYATDIAIDVLQGYSMSITERIIEEAGLKVSDVLSPINIALLDKSSNEESAGSLMGTVVPFMLIMSLLMGTMYPAIDTTAGERERGTLETVLTLPVTNQEVFFSKFLTVATIGTVSATLNIISMGGIGIYMYKLMKGVGADAPVDMSRFVPAIVVSALCILAFAVFISAISMCVCVFAKSFKEANNYVTPLALVVVFASMVSIMPNVELTSNMALIPVSNICLLIRDMLAFKFNLGTIGIVLISNVIYGMLSVVLLGKIYNSESILFGDEGASMQLFEKRSNIKKGGVPSLGDAWLVLAVTLLLMIYVGGMVQIKYGYLGVIVTQLIVAGVSVLVSLYTKKSMRETFKLNLPKLRHILGGLLMLFGGVLIGMILTAIASIFFKNSAAEMGDTMSYLMGDSFLISLLMVAVLPAICEELMFRGYIFASLENKLNYKKAIIFAGLLFGAYHMNITQFFATALLGIIMCYVAYKSRSILPGIIMHFTNNALSVVVMYYPDQVAKVAPVLAKETLMLSDVFLILAVGVALLMLGKYIIQKKNITQEER